MNDNQCWIVDEPYKDGVSYYFETEEIARWFQACRSVFNMIKGSSPTDGGNLFMTEDEMKKAVKKEPKIKRFIRQVYNAEDFINNKLRFCLWLTDAEPGDIKSSPFLYDRVKKVKEFRLSSVKTATQKAAERASLFMEIRQPESNYLLIPRHSSHLRKYIPIGFLPPEIIATDACITLQKATPYHFGILTSNVHMAWMRRVCGRLGKSYRYSNTIVYNCFAWPAADPHSVMNVTKTALEILKVREKYKNSSLADLYDEVTMPADLRKAHQKNDEAVMKTYGFPKNLDEPSIVDRMFELYYEARRRKGENPEEF